jgi:hypothetical protein
MRQNSTNPAPLAAGRAPKSFCLAAEHSEDGQPRRSVQAPNVIGIDPGVGRALTLMSLDGELIDVAEMPVRRDGSAASGNAPLPAELLTRWRPRQVVCEFGVYAAQGRRCRGLQLRALTVGAIESASGVLGFPIRFLTLSRLLTLVSPTMTTRAGGKRVVDCIKDAVSTFRELESLNGAVSAAMAAEIDTGWRR